MAAAAPEGEAAARLARLGAACAACFGSGREPSAELVAAVATALDCVTAADVGLGAEASPGAAVAPEPPRSALSRAAARLASLVGVRAAPPSGGGAPAVRYLAVHEGAAFTVGVFCLDAGAQLPLHDHPGMTVLSRLLYGQLVVRSFDWDEQAGPGAARLADEALLSGPAPCRLLRPAQGNLHALQARTPAAVLDVLGPPYDPRAGRGCSYFTEAEPRAAAPGDAARLERVPPSPHFYVARSTYRGAAMRVP